jgi:hypothetical protein
MKLERLLKPTFSERNPNASLPDVDDPNFYCRACELKLADKCSYRSHLKKLIKLISSL